ncbi:MAG TPA: hydroxysqualene dehydroxylase HpnE [Candidatus Kapabacteria bacterium]|mgnify:CR=1 FL=1|nr:hydroxysqualene dehydroxylase HpnE [Candidatus Kapabacteria bacterium]HPO62281.1 hydroxysqualene dehydroxylase HpnE [Candidatus Kapabacteria bacterium]
MNENKIKIAIIGGGVAGISAAVELCSKNIPFCLFEQRINLGGRASSFLDKETNETIDNGQHLISGAYHNFLSTLSKLGTDKYFFRQNGLLVPFLEKKEINKNDYEINKDFFNTAVLPGKAGKILGLLNLKSLNFESKLNIIKLFIKFQNKSFQVENKRVIDFLKEQKQTDVAIKYFWEPVVLATLNASVQTSSSLLLAEVLKRAFFSDSKSSALLFPSIGLSDYYANLESIINKNNSKLFLNKRIIQIVPKKIGFEILCSDSSKFDADYVISAIPQYSLMKILPAEIIKNPFFNEMKNYKYSPILSIYLWYEKEIFSDMFAALIGSRFHWLFNRNDYVKRKNALYSYTLTTSFADDLINLNHTKLLNLISEELKIFLNTKEKPKYIKIIKERRATLLITPEIEEKRYISETIIPGLFFAGDWTATGLPATIEGAAQSGVEAAKMVSISPYAFPS